ncbi:hypothetical protein ASL14_05925 [Paenibacillus sp. IHB B 3084]|nr:hypothetical protein ASL14_05925 [Paenibacillus sp. IHB B 3084]
MHQEDCMSQLNESKFITRKISYEKGVPPAIRIQAGEHLFLLILDSDCAVALKVTIKFGLYTSLLLF